MLPAVAQQLLRETSTVPVTALALLETRVDGSGSGGVYVVAGEHGRLCAYVVGGGHRDEPVARLDVLGEQPVHGIRVAEHLAASGAGAGRLLAWGAAGLCVVDALLDASDDAAGGRRLRLRLRLVAVGADPDWIHDAALGPEQPAAAVRCLAVTAHNELVSASAALGDGASCPATRLDFAAGVSPSRPMLYAARLAWQSWTSVLVAGGTVFGDVIVWTCRLAADGTPTTYSPLCLLSGHEGSVYGIDVSPPLRRPDGQWTRLLASCSDDRTIRVWDLDQSESVGATAVPHLATGFRPAASDPDSRLVASAMGHASRIWGVRFGPGQGPVESSGGLLPVYSFGEDATAQRWSLAFPRHACAPVPSATSPLIHAQTFSLHTGKHLWSSAVLRHRDLTLVATGGADGKICLIEDAPSLSAQGEPDHSVITVDVQDMIDSLPTRARLGCRGGELVNRYDFIWEDQMLVITSRGRLFLASLGPPMSWEAIDVDDGLAADLEHTYTLRAVGDRTALLGTSHGHLFFRYPDHVSRIAQVPGKVVEVSRLSALRRQAGTSHDPIEVLVHLYGSSDARYLTLDACSGRLVSHEKTCGLDASKLGRFSFAFTRASKLCIYTQARPAFRTLRPGTHGREVRALSCSGRYIASGAEDTTIRIWEYDAADRGG